MAAALFGEAGLAIHLAIVSLHALVLLTLSTALVELDLARAKAAGGELDAHLGRTLLSTARNTIIHPVVLPVLIGLAWNALGLPLPDRRRRDPADARPGGRAAVPGADRHVARVLRRAGRGARCDGRCRC